MREYFRTSCAKGSSIEESREGQEGFGFSREKNLASGLGVGVGLGVSICVLVRVVVDHLS